MTIVLHYGMYSIESVRRYSMNRKTKLLYVSLFLFPWIIVVCKGGPQGGKSTNGGNSAATNPGNTGKVTPAPENPGNTDTSPKSDTAGDTESFNHKFTIDPQKSYIKNTMKDDANLSIIGSLTGTFELIKNNGVYPIGPYGSRVEYIEAIMKNITSNKTRERKKHDSAQTNFTKIDNVNHDKPIVHLNVGFPKDDLEKVDKLPKLCEALTKENGKYKDDDEYVRCELEGEMLLSPRPERKNYTIMFKNTDENPKSITCGNCAVLNTAMEIHVEGEYVPKEKPQQQPTEVAQLPGNPYQASTQSDQTMLREFTTLPEQRAFIKSIPRSNEDRVFYCVNDANNLAVVKGIVGKLTLLRDGYSLIENMFLLEEPGKNIIRSLKSQGKKDEEILASLEANVKDKSVGTRIGELAGLLVLDTCDIQGKCNSANTKKMDEKFIGKISDDVTTKRINFENSFSRVFIYPIIMPKERAEPLEPFALDKKSYGDGLLLRLYVKLLKNSSEENLNIKIQLLMDKKHNPQGDEILKGDITCTSAS